MKIIEQHHYHEDEWLLAADDVDPLALPAGAWLVPSEVFAECELNTGPQHRFAPVLEADSEISDLSASVLAAPLLTIRFAAFTDGRAYSLARLLRRNGYRGDLRAIGGIGRDQYTFLVRCGFSSVAVNSQAQAAQFRAAMDDMSAVYQPAADTQTTIAALRRQHQVSL